jgi:hypothetical protein
VAKSKFSKLLINSPFPENNASPATLQP